MAQTAQNESVAGLKRVTTTDEGQQVTMKRSFESNDDGAFVTHRFQIDGHRAVKAEIVDHLPKSMGFS